MTLPLSNDNNNNNRKEPLLRMHNEETTTTTTLANEATSSSSSSSSLWNNCCYHHQQQQTHGCCSCCASFLLESVWPGLGLLGESYMLFSIGTMKPIWELLYPDCFAGIDCSEVLLQSLTISVVLGVITGMLAIGYAANYTGRRVGSILTASLMTAGAICLTALSCLFPPQQQQSSSSYQQQQADDQQLEQSSSSSFSTNAAVLLRCMSICLFVFGVGVGGEYPLAASSASERAMEELKKRMENEQQQQHHPQPDGLFKMETQQQQQKQQQQHETEDPVTPQTTNITLPQQESRGRRVQLVFTMQGVGIFCNSIIMTALLIVTGQTGNHNNNNDDNNNNNYDLAALLTIWRITYAIGAAILSTVLVTRIAFLTESTVWQKEQEKQKQQQQLDAAAAAAATTTFAVPEPANTQIDNNNNNIHTTLKTDPSGQPIILSSTTNTPVVQFQESSLSESTSVSSLSAPSVEHPYDQILRDVSSSSSLCHDPEYHNISSNNNNNNIIVENLPYNRSRSNNNKKGTFRLLIKNFGMRLMGASASWMLWDVAFYGNKLFQSSFILALTGENTTLLEFAVAATLNAAVALLGYFGAATIIDHPQVGRRNLQQWGLLLTGSLFVLCGICYDALSSATLVTMYLGSSFFGQLGPNATTFLLPAEIFPTEVRTLCHGIAAASGKCGALLAAIVFHYVPADLELFMISGYASFAACAITFWTIPETTGLDLYELDRKWHLIVQGRKAEYEGQANHPRYLSNYEINRLKMQKNTGKFSALDAVH